MCTLSRQWSVGMSVFVCVSYIYVISCSLLYELYAIVLNYSYKCGLNNKRHLDDPRQPVLDFCRDTQLTARIADTIHNYITVCTRYCYCTCVDLWSPLKTGWYYPLLFDCAPMPDTSSIISVELIQDSIQV